jgi:hypothetical protein
MPGAETRGRNSITIKGVVWHHTATGPNVSDARVAALLRDGRPDLAGPLSQVGVQRDGTWVIVALGRANHNGYGTWGNDSLGLEFYNDGVGEPFTNAQLHYGMIGTAAVLRRLGLDPAAAVKGHKETDPRRKIDPLIDMSMVRSGISHLLTPSQPVPQEDDVKDQIIFFDAGNGNNHAYRCTGLFGIYLDGEAINASRVLGIPWANQPSAAWPANTRRAYRLLDGPFKNV